MAPKAARFAYVQSEGKRLHPSHSLSMKELEMLCTKDFMIT